MEKAIFLIKEKLKEKEVEEEGEIPL